jgi:hypothetical protein
MVHVDQAQDRQGDLQADRPGHIVDQGGEDQRGGKRHVFLQHQVDVPVPDRIAVWVNSRSRRLRISERITRASQAQPKKRQQQAQHDQVHVLPHQHRQHDDDQEQRDHQQAVAQEHQHPVGRAAAVARTMPTSTAMMRETKPAISEMISELRTAKLACQKISCPFESVPNRYWADGAGRAAPSFHMVGSYGEKKESNTQNKQQAQHAEAQLQTGNL